MQRRLGVPLLPFDRGETFVSGVRGAVFSLPELAFVNLRKGSFDYVPREQRPDTGAELASSVRGQEDRDRPGAATRKLLHLASVQRDDTSGEHPLEFGPAVALRSRPRLGPERDLISAPPTTLGTGDRNVQPTPARVETP